MFAIDIRKSIKNVQGTRKILSLIIQPLVKRFDRYKLRKKYDTKEI
jgi:hypothetical protein